MALPSDLSDLFAWYDADVGRFDATSGGSSVTTDLGQIARWEDQSGNGRHLIQASSGIRPVWDASRALVVSEVYQGADQRFDCPGSFTLDRRAFSILCLLEVSSFYSSSVGTTSAANHFLAGGAENPNLLWGNTGRLAVYDGSIRSGDVTVTLPGNRCLVGWVGSAGGVKLWVNGSSYSISALSSGNVTFLSLLGYSSSGQGASQVGCKDLVVYSRALSDSEVTTTLLAYAASRGVSSLPGKRIFFVGDSITHGYGVRGNRTLAQRSALLGSFQGFVMAKSGATLADLESDRATCLDPLVSPDDVAIIFAGTNDRVQGANSATTHSRLDTLASGLQGQGVKVVVCTPLERSGTDLTGYRDLILANWTDYADELVDLYPLFASAELPDGIHPDGDQTQEIADLVGPAALSLLVSDYPLDAGPTTVEVSGEPADLLAHRRLSAAAATVQSQARPATLTWSGQLTVRARTPPVFALFSGGLSMSAFRPSDFLKASLEALAGTGGLLEETKIMLFKNNITPTPETVKADLVASTFTGYALSSEVVWSDPISVPSGWGILGDRKDFIATADSDPEFAYGYAILRGVSFDQVALVERFPSPVDMSVAGSLVSVSPLYAARHAAD